MEKRGKFSQKWITWTMLLCWILALGSADIMLCHYLMNIWGYPFGLFSCIAASSLLVLFAFWMFHFFRGSNQERFGFINIMNALRELESSNNIDHRKYLIERVRITAEDFRMIKKMAFRQLRFYKYSTVICSLLITVLLGLKVSGTYTADALSNVALILSAISSALITLMTFWNIEEYWIQNKLIHEQLKMLSSKIQYSERNSAHSEDQKNEEFEKHFLEYLTILQSFHVYWQGAQQQFNK